MRQSSSASAQPEPTWSQLKKLAFILHADQNRTTITVNIYTDAQGVTLVCRQMLEEHPMCNWVEVFESENLVAVIHRMPTNGATPTGAE